MERSSNFLLLHRGIANGIQQNLRVAVSFANSAPVGMPCVIYFGVNDDGTLEGKDFDTDTFQSRINDILEKTYLRVPYQQKTLQVGSKQIVAVIVIGSELRPHFAGHAYVRRGSESIDASQEQLDLLIAQRSNKMYRLAAEHRSTDDA